MQEHYPLYIFSWNTMQNALLRTSANETALWLYLHNKYLVYLSMEVSRNEESYGTGLEISRKGCGKFEEKSQNSFSKRHNSLLTSDREVKSEFDEKEERIRAFESPLRDFGGDSDLEEKFLETLVCLIKSFHSETSDACLCQRIGVACTLMCYQVLDFQYLHEPWWTHLFSKTLYGVGGRSHISRLIIDGIFAVYAATGVFVRVGEL
eukprot:TRINITY_DN6912_c0_g1_i1.p1 TRINITY_DN6912_c0_g1~~TRINITY_DN6912_c0_g1_i1.p1  ORF type:complete len:207 (+),score=27.61 TRINITY_DN6912_c0_g1_i1:425-1045(+)